MPLLHRPHGNRPEAFHVSAATNMAKSKDICQQPGKPPPYLTLLPIDVKMHIPDTVIAKCGLVFHQGVWYKPIPRDKTCQAYGLLAERPFNFEQQELLSKANETFISSCRSMSQIEEGIELFSGQEDVYMLEFLLRNYAEAYTDLEKAWNTLRWAAQNKGKPNPNREVEWELFTEKFVSLRIKYYPLLEDYSEPKFDPVTLAAVCRKVRTTPEFDESQLWSQFVGNGPRLSQQQPSLHGTCRVSLRSVHNVRPPHDLRLEMPGSLRSPQLIPDHGKSVAHGEPERPLPAVRLAHGDPLDHVRHDEPDPAHRVNVRPVGRPGHRHELPQHVQRDDAVVLSDEGQRQGHHCDDDEPDPAQS